MHFSHPGDASPVTTIVPQVVDMQWNGNADSYHLRFLAAGAATEDTCGDRVSADGQWKCVRPASASWFLLRDQPLVTMVAGLQPWVMENAEGSRVPAARDAGRAPCLLPSDAGEG